jgi:hypothetical protein
MFYSNKNVAAELDDICKDSIEESTKNTVAPLIEAVSCVESDNNNNNRAPVKIGEFKFLSKQEIFEKFNNEGVTIQDFEDGIIISGPVDDVDVFSVYINKYLNERIDYEIELKPHEARMLILYNLKGQYEKKFVDFKVKFQYIGANFSVIFEGIRKDIGEIKEVVRDITKKMKKIVVDGVRSVEEIDFFKTNVPNLFRLMQENQIKCTFEVDSSQNLLFAYLIDENDIDLVKTLVEKNILKKGSIEKNVKIELKLFEYRMFVVNGIERVVKKKYIELAINKQNKKAVELVGDEKNVTAAKEMIDDFLKKIVREDLSYNKEGIKFVKDNEKDFVTSLGKGKISCVVDFDFEKNCFLIYAIDQKMIDECKIFIETFLKK